MQNRTTKMSGIGFFSEEVYIAKEINCEESSRETRFYTQFYFRVAEHQSSNCTAILSSYHENFAE